MGMKNIVTYEKKHKYFRKLWHIYKAKNRDSKSTKQKTHCYKKK